MVSVNKYQISEKLTNLANEIIETEPIFINLRNCRIAYLKSDKEKTASGRIVYADCAKVSDKIKAVASVDFIITVYKNADDLSERAMRALMEHELMHVSYDPETRQCKIIPHDLQDFIYIIGKYGADWIAN